MSLIDKDGFAIKPPFAGEVRSLLKSKTNASTNNPLMFFGWFVGSKLETGCKSFLWPWIDINAFSLTLATLSALDL